MSRNSVSTDGSTASVRKADLVAVALSDHGFEDVAMIAPDRATDVLTPGRLAILEFLGSDSATSVRELARRLDRDEGAVSRDCRRLAREGLLELQDEGQRRRPVLQHETIVVEPIT